MKYTFIVQQNYKLFRSYKELLFTRQILESVYNVSHGYSIKAE